MKKVSFKAAGAIALGLSLSAALPTYAAAYNVSQADFDAAIGGTVTKNIDCSNVGYCVGEGDYTLTSDVNLATADYEFDLDGNSSLDLGGHTFIGTISNYNEGANVTVSNGTIDGYVFPYGAESFTLSDITGEEIGIQPTDSTLNIESGTYTSTSNDSVIYTGTNSTINITGGTFETTGVMIPVIQANNWGDTGEVTLNISGGTFTATNGMAVDFSNENDPMYHITPGAVNANISGGTFSGANAALSIIDPTLNNIQLSGGTYSFTDTSDNTNAAIVSWDGNPDSITGLLADGYHFTNGDVTTVETDWGTTIAVLGDTEVVADGSEDANKGGVKSPDTGVFTAESGSASVADGALVMLIAAAVLGLLGYKKFARK